MQQSEFAPAKEEVSPLHSRYSVSPCPAEEEPRYSVSPWLASSRVCSQTPREEEAWSLGLHGAGLAPGWAEADCAGASWGPVWGKRGQSVVSMRGVPRSG